MTNITIPAFFIPSIHPSKSEYLYLRIRSNVQPQCIHPITDRRIFKLICEHNGDIKVGRTEIEVGKKLHEKGETVIAIFESNGWYLVCTKSRGALSGHPNYISGDDVIQVIEFANYEPTI